MGQSRVITGLVALVITLLAQGVAASILVRDPTGRWAANPLQSWFDYLRNQDGLYCCANADGQPVEDGDWDMKNNSYRVILHGQWTIVPNNAVVLAPNKFGKAIVWLWNKEDLLNQWGATVANPIRCFIPGTGA
jgi:hypothetical protein